MPPPESRSRLPKLKDAGVFQPQISSFRLYLAAKDKAAKTVRTYTEVVQCFAAARLPRQGIRASWEEIQEAGPDLAAGMTASRNVKSSKAS